MARCSAFSLQSHSYTCSSSGFAQQSPSYTFSSSGFSPQSPSYGYTCSSSGFSPQSPSYGYTCSSSGLAQQSPSYGYTCSSSGFTQQSPSNSSSFDPESPSYHSPQQLTSGPLQAGCTSDAFLYVGDLAKSVTEEQLFHLFSQVGSIVSVKVCRDVYGKESLGYGYVNYQTLQEANSALELLNHTKLGGKSIRLMFSNRDPTKQKSGLANIFIKKLDRTIDNRDLHDIFVHFGPVLSCKVATDSYGQSKGYGFVQFEKEESAQEAIKVLNGMLFNDREVYIGLFVPRQQKDRANGSLKFTKDKVLFDGRAQVKVDREAELKAKTEHERTEKLEKLKGTKLFLKNLDYTLNDQNLQEFFAPFGKIISTKILRDSLMQSLGKAFVQFSSPEEANRAVFEMNGKMIGGRPLHVSIAESKEERRARLQAHYAQLNAPVNWNPPIPASPSYYQCQPKLVPQQLYFGQLGLDIKTPQSIGF